MNLRCLFNDLPKVELSEVELGKVIACPGENLSVLPSQYEGLNKTHHYRREILAVPARVEKTSRLQWRLLSSPWFLCRTNRALVTQILVHGTSTQDLLWKCNLRNWMARQIVFSKCVVGDT